MKALLYILERLQFAVVFGVLLWALKQDSPADYVAAWVCILGVGLLNRLKGTTGVAAGL